MEFIALTPENLEQEHICCAMADKKSLAGVTAKKAWLACRMAEGLKFIKLDERGKVFIEYGPAEKAWVPLDQERVEGYIFVNCFWVSGSFKGKGYGKALLAQCEADAREQGKKGVIFTVGRKKLPYLTDKKFLEKQGYRVCDTTPTGFELVVNKFETSAPDPKFAVSAHTGKLTDPDSHTGIDIFYTAQCPFTVPYIGLIASAVEKANSEGVAVRIRPIDSAEKAQQHAVPVTTYSVFVDGLFRTHEILTEAKLNKILAEYRS